MDRAMTRRRGENTAQYLARVKEQRARHREQYNKARAKARASAKEFIDELSLGNVTIKQRVNGTYMVHVDNMGIRDIDDMQYLCMFIIERLEAAGQRIWPDR